MVDGVWKIEMWGPYGWETVATGILAEGRYLDASQRHWSQGTYSVEGDRIAIEATTNVHTGEGHLFGRTDRHFNVHIKGTVSGPTLTGEIKDSAMKFTVPMRSARSRRP